MIARRETLARRTSLLAALAGLLLAAAAPVGAEPVSLESLLEKMVDRDRLARFPEPAYVCRQASSYDRDTVAPNEPGWFANWDRSQFVRREENAGRTEWVLLDADGPGAVVRFCGTWHGPRGGPFSNGTMRVYLDGQPEPAIDGPIADLISGQALVGPPLSESVSPETPYERRGHNLYLPIPYAKHCKITYESDKLTDVGGKQDEALYYQINYRTYEPGTDVVTFARGQLEEHAAVLGRVGQRLVRSGRDRAEPTLRTVNFSGDLGPQDKLPLAIEGPAAVRELTLELEADDLPQALRSTVLEIAFDGERTVWCPVGDFFGIGYRVSPYQTWYTRVDENGKMTAFWVMPFEESCELAVHNLGDQPVHVRGGGAVGPWTWDDRSMHFHATWRQYTKIDTGPNKDQTGNGAFDVNYVEVRGKGRRSDRARTACGRT